MQLSIQNFGLFIAISLLGIVIYIYFFNTQQIILMIVINSSVLFLLIIITSMQQILLPQHQDSQIQHHFMVIKKQIYKIEEHILNISLTYQTENIPLKLRLKILTSPLFILQIKQKQISIEKKNGQFQITVNKLQFINENSSELTVILESDLSQSDTYKYQFNSRLLFLESYNNLLYSVIPQYLSINNYVILIGIITNNFEILIPLIQFNQMYYYLGYLTNQLGDIITFYQNLNNCVLDLFLYIRKMNLVANSTIPKVFSNANLSNSILYNYLPEIILLVVIVFSFLLIKLATILLKLEFLRKLSLTLKSILNGYLYVILPKSIFYIGFQARFFSLTTFLDYINLVVICIFCLMIILYPIYLAFSIKKVIQNKSDKDAQISIGLIDYIDQTKGFQFDCLKYSILYFPVMNYISQLIFYAALGCSYDFTKAQIGCAVISQLFSITILINQNPFKDNWIAFINFSNHIIILVIIGCYISIDISESIMHPQIASYIQFSSILSYVVGLFLNLVVILVQIFKHILILFKNKSKQSEKKNSENEEQESQHQSSNLAKLQKLQYIKQSEKDNIEINNDFQETDFPIVKIKKVRNGRIL